MRLFFCTLLSSVLLIAFVPHKKIKTGTVKITFSNTIDGHPISLEQKQYTNTFGEQYTIDKLKYYISNIQLHAVNNKVVKEPNSYHLINEWGDTDSTTNDFFFTAATGTYKSISFLIGVDSIMNVSGAQTDALDPLNGMYWTWNTGYIMFKIEGNSPQSNIADNKFEYHIGGFSGSNNVLRRVELPLSSLQIKKNSNTEIIIEADIAKLWQAENNIKIAEMPVCTTPGKKAADIANNYSKIFSVKYILNK